MVNAQAERVFGYDRSELLGQPIEMLVPDRFRGRPSRAARVVFRRPGVAPYGRGPRLVRPEEGRQRIPVEIGLNPIETDEGAMVLSAIVDVSERQQRALAASNLAAIVESSGDPILGKDLNGVITSWNPAAEALFGYAQQEIVGKHISILIPPDRIQEEDAIMGRIKAGKRVDHLETIRRAKNGRLIAVALTISPIRNSHGDIVGASKIVRDVSELRAAADKLRLSEERFRSIFGAVSEGVFITDALNGEFIDVNEPGAAMFGYTIEELTGRDIQAISSGVEPYTHAQAIQWHRKAAESGRPQVFDWRCKAKDGRLFWGEISLRFASIGGQRVVLAIVRDVTERRAIEAQLRQAQKMEAIGLLTGGIAHDFNNLLAIIHGNLELIKDASQANADINEMAGDALRAAARGASLTHQLLAFSRQQALAPKLVQLDELVSQLAALLRRTLGETIEIRTTMAPGLWPVKIDPGQLENALVNLAVNARDAMPDGGRLTLRLPTANSMPTTPTSPGVEPDLRSRFGERQRHRHAAKTCSSACSNPSSPPRHWARAPASD